MYELHSMVSEYPSVGLTSYDTKMLTRRQTAFVCTLHILRYTLHTLAYAHEQKHMPLYNNR